MKNITIRLTEATIAKIKAMADKDRRTVSAYIRKTLEELTSAN